MGTPIAAENQVATARPVTAARKPKSRSWEVAVAELDH
jgi:hypothetical protein